MPTPRPSPADVLDFWFGSDLSRDWPEAPRHALWFGGGPELDAQITERFGPLVKAALDGELADWEARIDTRLALVIVLDQLTRNVFRGSARAFAGDDHAQKLVLQSLTLSLDAELPRMGRVFLYMPLMHAESVALQYECVARFTLLSLGSPAPLSDALGGHLRAAREHLDIIEAFGRFPHRNATLGRPSTAAEAAFLQNGPRFGQ